MILWIDHKQSWWKFRVLLTGHKTRTFLQGRGWYKLHKPSRVLTKNLSPVFPHLHARYKILLEKWVCATHWLTDYIFCIGSKGSSILASVGLHSRRFSSLCTPPFQSNKIKFVNLIIPFLGLYLLSFTIQLVLHYFCHVQIPSWISFSGFGPKEG